MILKTCGLNQLGVNEVKLMSMITRKPAIEVCKLQGNNSFLTNLLDNELKSIGEDLLKEGLNVSSLIET